MAIILRDTSENSFTLPKYYIPSDIFKFERDITLHKQTGSEETIIRGDGGVKPFRITFKATVHKPTYAELSTYLRSLISTVESTVEIRYDTLKISILKAWVIAKTSTSHQNTLDLELVFIPLYPDIPNWTVGSTYWGETSWTMGSTAVLLGDT